MLRIITTESLSLRLDVRVQNFIHNQKKVPDFYWALYPTLFDLGHFDRFRVQKFSRFKNPDLEKSFKPLTVSESYLSLEALPSCDHRQEGLKF